MRLTTVLCHRHAKYYYWGFGKGEWGRPKKRESHWKEWKRRIRIQAEKPIPQVATLVPDGVVVEDAVAFVKKLNTQKFDFDAVKIWPYIPKHEKGTVEDPKYKVQMANVFNRRTVILEGFKGAANFSNTIIQSDESLPELIQRIEEEVVVDSEFMDTVNRRIDWCRKDDGYSVRLAKRPVFPRLNIRVTRVFGLPEVRKEFNTLSTLYDLSDLFVAKHYGFLDRRKILSPRLNLAFNREDKLSICNLNCDFVTTIAVNNHSQSSASLKPLFSEEIASTIDTPLIDISPCNWEICFNKTHFYDEDYSFEIPRSSQVHTIFLSTNYLHNKKLVDRFLKGRVVMFCYGYAVAEARKRFGNFDNYKDAINYKDLPEPITVQCVFINESKENIGFAFFQLNTLSFDSKVKNQIWFGGLHDVNSEIETIVRKMIAVQLYATPLLKQKTRNFDVN